LSIIRQNLVGTNIEYELSESEVGLEKDTVV